ncbi:MAG TPA: hypothetical protein VE992_04740 [Solirubrobacteraceae bacterium]|nr:hypothetical protein [Solirubrobacteraceae bacterium]
MRLPGRPDRIDRIERQIADFQERATELLRAEQAAAARLSERRTRAAEPGGRLRRGRRQRALRRAELRACRTVEARQAFVEQRLRAIMLTLEEQSRRTRERLDRQLERLIPVQAEWERLRGAFDAVEIAIATPAVESLAGQWRGTLQIPEFPVQEREGYLRPFPQGALLF